MKLCGVTLGGVRKNSGGLRVFRCELDSHADTCAFDKNGVILLNDTGSTLVETALKQHGQVEVPIGTCVVAYDNPYDHHTYLLYFHNSMCIQGLNTHLMAEFQMRDFGIRINSTPLQHLHEDARTDHSHSIFTTGLHVHMSLNGTMSGFECRKPTREELHDKYRYTHIDMTLGPTPPWDPHALHFQDVEDSLRSSQCRNLSPLQLRGLHDKLLCDEKEVEVVPDDVTTVTEAETVPSDDEETVDDSPLRGPSYDFDNDTKPNLIEQKLRVKRPDRVGEPPPVSELRLASCNTNLPVDVDSYAESMLHQVQDEPIDSYRGTIEELGRMLSSATTLKKRKGFVSAKQLAQNWGIGLETARKTIENTTQRAVRDFTHTTGGRRLKPYTWMLKYPRLECEVFTDTLFGKVQSL